MLRPKNQGDYVGHNWRPSNTVTDRLREYAGCAFENAKRLSLPAQSLSFFPSTQPRIGRIISEAKRHCHGFACQPQLGCVWREKET